MVSIKSPAKLKGFSLKIDEFPQTFSAGLMDSRGDSLEPRFIYSDDELTIISPPERDETYLTFQSENMADKDNVSVLTDSGFTYGIKTRKGENPYRFKGKSISIYISSSETRLASVDFKGEPEEEQALLSDLEEIIETDKNTWRREDYELYRWNLFPSMLIMDTADYNIQADFFKRMAFFIEKKNYAGKLLGNDELSVLHGWNAHDYRAADLAVFFNEAAGAGFQLNSRELELKKILVDNGVLKESSGRVRPGKGGILSFSRSSDNRLRWLFLTHECYHGVFFDNEYYVRDVYTVWNSLSDDEREFWRIFLDMYGYNVTDEYLLVNEFQAYLMQQKTGDADVYFRGKIKWILGLRPDLTLKMNELLARHGETFSRSALAVEKSAYSLTGIKAGDLVLKHKK